ncbi:hypothetical protein SeMB42_g00526 [Synchytrium endobioticum]|uniref:Uncharacterized protein n=1 Tax=Synchytrium endobioticum TaxID=286115 RepID=A0A507DR89_9FUNG|nr:hypothetical protein SeMB42_g00526 [Synchytrium endobioticum]
MEPVQFFTSGLGCIFCSLTAKLHTLHPAQQLSDISSHEYRLQFIDSNPFIVPSSPGPCAHTSICYATSSNHEQSVQPANVKAAQATVPVMPNDGLVPTVHTAAPTHNPSMTANPKPTHKSIVSPAPRRAAAQRDMVRGTAAASPTPLLPASGLTPAAEAGVWTAFAVVALLFIAGLVFAIRRWKRPPLSFRDSKNGSAAFYSQHKPIPSPYAINYHNRMMGTLNGSNTKISPISSNGTGVWSPFGFNNKQHQQKQEQQSMTKVQPGQGGSGAYTMNKQPSPPPSAAASLASNSGQTKPVYQKLQPAAANGSAGGPTKPSRAELHQKANSPKSVWSTSS